MGTQFFWFYDLLIIAVFLAITFKCYKKGFLSVIVGFIAIALSFVLAMNFSSGVSDWIYNKFMNDRVTEYVENGLLKLGNEHVLLKLSSVNTDKIKINGKTLDEIPLEPDSAGKITLDISSLDYTDTGLSEIDLELFGIYHDSADFSKINAGKINVTPISLEKYSLGTMVLAKTLSQAIQKETSYGVFLEITENLSKMFPFISGKNNQNDSVADIICVIIETEIEDISASLIEDLVKPLVLPPLKSIVFFMIFILLVTVLMFAARALKLVNRIPVIGKINSFFGIIIGIFESLIILMLICIVIHIIISLTGNTIVLLNTTTIENTIIFKKIYNLEILGVVIQ